ncbi:MAG: VWA domain-containing protein [Verrucomicrobium sp.]
MNKALLQLRPLRDRWLEQWPSALEAWSRFTRLSPPALCLKEEDARKEGLTGSFAMIRLADQAIVVSLPEVMACGVEDLAVEILAHEIGHHVLAPANLTDHGRMLSRMRWGLPTVEHLAPMVANLYTDILINDRLQRSAGLRMDEVYRRIQTDKKTGKITTTDSGAVWKLYMRIYEILWRLDRGSLAGTVDDRTDGDAWLGARLVRVYSRDWLSGSGRFAALLLPHLLEDKKSQNLLEKFFDTRAAALHGEISGLTDLEPGEKESAIHPALDPELNGQSVGADAVEADDAPPLTVAANTPSQGQTRQPFEYGELLRAAGVPVNDHEAAVRYYREQALPHLIPFPTRELPRATDPLPEGLEPWELGDPMDAVDWLQSVMISPRIIPGVTTVQRVWGESEGTEPRREPLDLDLYVDSSGSMANPQRLISYPALAGAIICLSALRTGARVQATLWSWKQQFLTTPGFVRDETSILRVLTGYFGGGTAFPIHQLRDTFGPRPAAARAAHILIISDEGVDTLFNEDEKGNSGWDVSAMALEKARGGGTMVLNLPQQWETTPGYGGAHETIKRAREEQGWRVHRVATWEDQVAVARDFSRQHYGQGQGIANVVKPRTAAQPRPSINL